jgi:hypothetical protein
MKHIIVCFILILISTASCSQKRYFCQSRQITLKERNNYHEAPISDNYLYWNIGCSLYINFMNGSKRLHEKVMQIGNDWSKYASIKFTERETGESNIRIIFNDTGLVKTAVGVMNNMIPQDEPTCFIDTSNIQSASLFKSIILHTFGHLIGMQHENAVPFNGRKWNYLALDKYAIRHEWDESDLKQQIMYPYSTSISNSLIADRKSVMYYVPKEEWVKEKTLPLNDSLSMMDKTVAGSLYPYERRNTRLKPFFDVTRFKSLRIQKNDYGFSFYPEMEIKTKDGIKLQIGVFLLDDNNNGIPVFESSYSFDDSLATVKGIINVPDGSYQLNYTANDVGLYLPYSAIPTKYKGKLKAVFKVFYISMYNVNKQKEFVSNPVDLIFP